MIKFSSHSGIHTLKVVQDLKTNINEAWAFFSNPNNLSKITPKEMGFNITSETPEYMFEGQIISYKVSPILGIKLNWVTEITHVKNQLFFVDEQRFGPYTMWHHEHHFEEIDGMIRMTDKVSFKVPFGLFGRLFVPIIVKPQLRKIFNYRFEILEKKYNHA